MNLHITYYNFLKKAAIIVSRTWKSYSVISLILLVGFVAQAQNTTIVRSTSCLCLDNNAPAGKAQFFEELTINSGINETWYISSVSGFYQESSPVPPAMQIPFTVGVMGDTMDSDGNGQYRLAGIHLEDLGYSIEITNGIDTGRLDNILCEFPTGEIEGDSGICDGETITYVVSDVNQTYNYQWSFTGQGVVVGGSTGTSYTIDWNDNGSGQELVQLFVEGPTGCGSNSALIVDFEENLTLACNDLIQITISSACIIEVSPDDILENMKYDDTSYEITIIDPETGTIIPQGTLASDYLLDTLEISIEHLCSANSCWGYVIFEDKYVPPLVCENDTILCSSDDSPLALGFPLPDDAIVSSIGNNSFLVENFDPCGDATLEFEDFVQVLNCAQDYASITTRIWTITDFSGSTGTCQQQIFKTRTTIDDVIFPGDYDGITNQPLQCDGSFPTLPNGNPDPIGTGVPTGGLCDHLNVSYTDLISEICGATYKVVRKWKVIDECLDTFIVNNQLIKIEDNDAPEFPMPNSQNFLIQDVNSCDVDVSVPVPTIFTDCSDVEFEAEIVKLDENGNIAGTITAMNKVGPNFKSNNREIGEHEITITGTDECGFSKSLTFSIYILDGTPPIAVCDQSTTIALDNTGNALVPVSTFDNGSFDNCTLDKVEISRGSNSCGASTGFSDHIALCCADANTEVMVTLRVTDLAGNINTCMVVVAVQDKKVPILTCPSNTSIACDSNYDNLNQFGTATATDNCSVIISEVVDEEVNNCGVGTIYRTFTAIDPAGNEAVCTQIINVINNNPFVYGDITWPADYSTNNCVSPELDPDDLPSIYSRPILPNKPCSDAVADHSDKIFTNANGACKTIFRTWTVIDQCTGNEFEFIQKLYIDDNADPIFNECSNKTLTGESVEDCGYIISYTKEATDDCTMPVGLAYTYIIDIDNNGGADITGNTSELNEVLTAGTHKIIWSVRDPCNNQATCTEIITIEDLKKPTPYCLGGISTVVMPSTGTIGVWASDFNLDSKDNCTDDEDLVYSFSPDQNETGITFTCEDLEGLDEKFFTLEVYVHDEAGNFDFCTTTIRITATTACNQTGTISLGGSVTTEDAKSMKEVLVELVDNTQSVSYQGQTDELGIYAFQDLPMMMEYSMVPTYDGDVLNGITTFDIILIQKHILGIEIFDSPYKVIAADINSSESITGADIVQLRKLILGHFAVFPSNTSWRFVSADQQFGNINYPWPLEEGIDILGDDNYMEKDFISVKIGDVNLSRSTSLQDEELETRSKESILIEYSVNMEGEDNIVSFQLTESQSVYGAQIGLASNTMSTIQQVRSNHFDVEDAQIRVDKNNNVVLCSFSRAFAQRVDSELFSINFGPTSPQKLTLEQWLFQSEIYLHTSEGIQAFNIDLRQKVRQDKDQEGLQVFQNTPNPFNENTEVRFFLPKKGQVILEIRNTDGVLVYTKKEIFKEGMNKFQLTSAQLPNVKSGGVLIYSIITANERISNKMVAIK